MKFTLVLNLIKKIKFEIINCAGTFCYISIKNLPKLSDIVIDYKKI